MSPTKTHHFDESCAVEAKWVPILDAWLEEAYVLREATPAEQRRGIDRVVADADGEHTIDYKCDEAWARTDNVFIETISNTTTGRKGWALTSEADWLLYYLTPEKVLVCRFEKLRAALQGWTAVYPTKTVRNPTFETRGVCIPPRVLLDVAEYQALLTAGDAPVLRWDEGDWTRQED